MAADRPLPNDVPSLHALVQRLQQELAAGRQPRAATQAATPPSPAEPPSLAVWQEQNRQLRAELADSTRSYEQRLADLQHEHVTLQAEHAALQRDLAGAPQQALPDTLGEAQARIRQLTALMHSLERENFHLLFRLRKVLRRLYGRSSERLDANQPLLFPDVTLPPPPATTSTEPQAKRGKRKARPHGRRRLPDHLERQLCVHELPAEQRHCPRCQTGLRNIGVDVTEQLEIEPLRFYVLRHEQHKYICPRCNGQDERPAAAAALSSPPVDVTAAAPTVGEAAALDANNPGVLAAPVVALAACVLAVASAPLNEAAETIPLTLAAAPVGCRVVLPVAAATAAPPAGNSLSAPDSATSAGPDPPPGPEPPVGPQESPPGFDPRSIYTVPKPRHGLAGCLAGPVLLAWVLVQKFADYVPLHRLAHILARSGERVPATTLGDWVAHGADLLQPLYDLMHERMLACACCSPTNRRCGCWTRRAQAHPPRLLLGLRRRPARAVRPI